MTGFLFSGGAGGDINGALITATGSTTAISLANRFSYIRNVKDFGALGNSDINASTGNDDTSAIQAAITAVEAVAGGTIFFPAGYYKVTAALTFTLNNCGYIFQGVGACAADAGGGGSTLVANFAGFVLDRNNVATSGAIVRITNLGVRNGHASGGGIRCLGTNSSMIDHCTVQANTYCIQQGYIQSPASATFTANSAGTTTLTVSGISGTIDPNTFPCPISGAGVPGGTAITAFGTSTGGNGTVITNNATTLSGASVSTNPNAATEFSSVILNCKCNGLGSFNSDPSLSWTGIGIQISTNSMVISCHCDALRIGVRCYGGGNYIYGCQFESDTYGIVLGQDVANTGSTTGGVISGSTFEGDYVAILVRSGNSCVIDGIDIQGEVDGSHQSTYGILIDSCQGLHIRSATISGAFASFGIYVSGAAGDCRRIRVETSDVFSLSKDASINWSCMSVVQTVSIGALSCTLAQLVTALTAGDINIGERRLISDSNTALASQVYNAVVTGGSSNLASVWFDGTNVRYG